VDGRIKASTSRLFFFELTLIMYLVVECDPIESRNHIAAITFSIFSGRGQEGVESSF
jgi:hypothetical protein